MEHVSVYVDEPVARRSAGRRKAAVYLGLAVLLAAASLVAANAAGSSTRSLSARGAGKAGSVVPQSGGCLVTFTNPGPPAMTVCVSGHGNINQLEYNPFGAPVGHMRHRGVLPGRPEHSEHRVLGRGHTGEASWGVATQSSTATTTTVTRTTIDGIYTLTQNIFFKYGSRLVLIGNLVKNNDTVSHHVRFNRYADIDMEGTAGRRRGRRGRRVGVRPANQRRRAHVARESRRSCRRSGPSPSRPGTGRGRPRAVTTFSRRPPPQATTWRSCSTTRRSLRVPR